MNSEIVKMLEAGDGNPRNSEGSFIQLKDGRIMFVYSRYNGDSWYDHASADLAAIYSADGGRTLPGEPEIVVRNQGDGNVMSVSLLRLHCGRIAMVYIKKRFIEGVFCDCRPLITISADEGVTWSPPRYCIKAPGYYVVNNDRIIQLESGRLLLPAAYHRWQPNDISIDDRAVSLMFYSDNGGEPTGGKRATGFCRLRRATPAFKNPASLNWRMDASWRGSALTAAASTKHFPVTAAKPGPMRSLHRNSKAPPLR